MKNILNVALLKEKKEKKESNSQKKSQHFSQ